MNKVNLLLGIALTSWLMALSPIPNLGKAAAYSISLISAIQSVQISKELIKAEKRENVVELMSEELEQTEIALQTYYQEESLKNEYALTYSPEVREEINQNLESLLSKETTEHPLETSTSTSELKTAIKLLLEAGKSETFIIENILGCKGRKFKEGKEKLREILGENE